MHIQHRISGTHGLFFVPDADGEGRLAELVYAVTNDGKMIIEHTGVEEELRGQNVGYELVHAAVEHARQYEMKIQPICPFAKAIFDKKPDFADVLA